MKNNSDSLLKFHWMTAVYVGGEEIDRARDDRYTSGDWPDLARHLITDDDDDDDHGNHDPLSGSNRTYFCSSSNIRVNLFVSTSTLGGME